MAQYVTPGSDESTHVDGDIEAVSPGEERLVIR